MAASKRWGGDVFSFVWSDPDNWDPSGIPQPDDDLVFHGTAIVSHFGLMFNDLTNLTVRSLHFSANAIPEIDWTLNGNALTVTHTIDASHTDDLEVDINCAIILGGNLRAEASFGPTFVGDAALHLNGPIDLNGHNLTLVETGGSADMDVAGAISGVGNLIIDSHEGSVELKGNAGNTFVGSVTLASGSELLLNKGSGLAVPGPLIIGTNSTVKLDHPHQIADPTTVRMSSGAEFKLQGNSETIEGLFIGNSPGPYLRDTVVDSGDATLSVIGNITVINNDPTNPVPVIQGRLGLTSGSHVIHTSGSNDFALKIEARVIGEGGITKRGNRALMLSGDSSFAGDAVIEEGLVHVRHANALGAPSGATILEGGELEVRDAAIGIETLWVNHRSSRIPELGGLLSVLGVSSWAGPIALSTNLTVSGGDMTFSGPISGPGDLRLIFNDRVQLTGTEPNTYTGDTLTDAVLLELNKPPGVTAFRGRLFVNSGSGAPAEVRWLQDYQCVGADVTLFPGALINLNNHREDFGPVTFHGGAISTGTGELGIYGLVTVNPSSDFALISGRLGLPPGPHEFYISDGAAFPDLRIDATVLGAGSLRKTGPGQMWLAASNTYEGLTTVAEGALSVLNPFGLGAISGWTTVNDGATLELNFTGAPMPEPLAIRGTGLNGNGALGGFGDVTLRPTFPSIYAAIDLTTDATIAVAAGARLTVDGFISGIGPLTKAGGGTLVLANSNPNIYSGDTIVADGVLNLSKPNSAISVPGDLVVGPAPLNSSAVARWSTRGGMNPISLAYINASSLLDLNGNDQTLYRLYLSDGGDVQTGAGKLSFQADAIVNVGSQSPLGLHEGSTISGNIGLAPNSTLTFSVNAFAPTPPFNFGPELEVNAAIPAPAENLLRERAGLTKFGAGRMRLFGNNSFRGWVNIGEGALIAANSTALGAVFFQSGTYVFNSGSLQLEGGVNIEGENLVLNSTATPALEGLFGEGYWSGQVTLSRDSSIGVAPGTVLQLAGVIAGTGNLTKLGVGTLRFGGGNANTYSGGTSVNEGTLFMSKPDGIAAVPGSLSIGTPAGLPAVAVNLTSYQVIGNIFVNRGGLLNVNDQVENVDHLWLTEGGDVRTTTGILFLKSGGSIQVVPGAVGDPSTIAGNLDMDAGAHVINVGSGTSAAGAPDLEITALVTSSLGPVTPRKYGLGTLRLAANNTYSGTTVVDEGILRMDGVQPQSSVQVNAAGTLQGIGVLDSIGFGGNGVVAPGASPGILTCNNLLNTSGSGILEIELNGPAPGANGYDQLNVNGIVTLSGITLRVRANFIAKTNQQFVLIDNQGANAAGGTFIGLAQNADVVAGDQIFRISYFGRDGNDVVLTKIADVFRPVLSIERIGSSVRLAWPASFTGYTLQSTTNLSLPNWTATLPLPVITGTNHVVTNASSVEWKFYRLFKP